MTAMAPRRRASLRLETLEAPDASFMAAIGAYVAAVLVAMSLTVATAVGASTATILGSIPSAATVGLIAGGMASSYVTGLPERLGRQRRRLAVSFVVPLSFTVLSLIAFFSSILPRSVALGAGIGAMLTLFLAFVVTTMARTRYADAMTPEEPLAVLPLLKSNQDLHWIGLGVVCFCGYGTSILLTGDPTSGNTVLWLVAWGIFALYRGMTFRFSFEDSDREGRVSRFFGSESPTSSVDVQWLPKLRVHEAGMVIARPMQQRFISWQSVADVCLTADELVVKRHCSFDVRCDRVVIEDGERVYREIERARTGAQVCTDTLNTTTSR